MDEITAYLPGLSPVENKELCVRFAGGRLSSDGGVLVLREIEKRLGLAARLAASAFGICAASTRWPVSARLHNEGLLAPTDRAKPRRPRPTKSPGHRCHPNPSARGLLRSRHPTAITQSPSSPRLRPDCSLRFRHDSGVSATGKPGSPMDENRRISPDCHPSRTRNCASGSPAAGCRRTAACWCCARSRSVSALPRA